MRERYDVVIMGGGLAGLSLGLQLARRQPQTTILIAEQREGPAPDAAFKVGESTVEVSAHYFAEVLGLRDHIEADQLPKMGLRFFFPAGGNEDIARRPEWGGMQRSSVASYQLDRGRFENELAARNHAFENTELLDACTVEDVELNEDADHVVTLSRGGETHQVRAGWAIDTTGYRQLIKRKLGLGKEVSHKINSSWMRLGERLDIEDWSDDEAWHARMAERGLRGLSTNHLMGEGYWVWLIPLATGATSIGIVADPRFHPWEEINTQEGALAWLERHEPQLANHLASRHDKLIDFLKVEDFAYGCERVFSPQRWGMSGVSGVFLDPFYSPGSDFIALANTFLTELIANDLDGAHDPESVELLNNLFLLSFNGALAVYEDNYEFWGDAVAMSAKIGWDCSTYWTVMAPLSMNEKWTDAGFFGRIGGDMFRCLGLAEVMQAMFRDWHRLRPPPVEGGMCTLQKFDELYKVQCELNVRYDDDDLVDAFARGADRIEALAVVLFHRAAQSLGDDAPDPGARIVPKAISLDPGSWEERGLFGDDGLTLEEALARVPGVEQLWLPGSTVAASPAR